MLQNLDPQRDVVQGLARCQTQVRLLLMVAFLHCFFLPSESAARSKVKEKKNVATQKSTPKKAETDVTLSLSKDGTAVWSDVIQKNLTGLQFETQSKGFVSKAQEFVAFRSERMTGKKRAQWASNCVHDATRSDESIFCDFLNDSRGGFLSEVRQPAQSNGGDDAQNSENPTPVIALNDDEGAAGSSRTELPVEQVTQLILAGDVKGLKQSSEKSLYRALRKFSDWSALEGASEKILSSPGCQNPAIFSSFGMKAEEYFPDEKYRKLAVDFYSRASTCADEGDAATKARYRLGLLQIWNGNCAQAESLLSKVSEGAPNDFTVRSLYWRATCAKNTGNKLLFSALKGRLLKDHPLTYHGLLVGGESSESLLHVAQILDNTPPKVLFRSKTRPELNRAVRAIEQLISMRQVGLAAEMLRTVERRMKSAEKEFRLYVGILAGRNGDNVSQFRILSSVFREDPTTLSRESLKTFYPLHRFDVLKNHGKKIDPYLVAALIRQESGFNEQARSPAGALGLMQIMPATARKMERVSKRELMDPRTNIRLGIRYFGGLLERFDGDAELALAGYNAGPGKVDQWKRRYTMQDRMLFLDLIPYKETRDYVSLIARNYYWYLQLYRSPAVKLKQGGGSALGEVGGKSAIGEADRRPAFTLFKSS